MGHLQAGTTLKQSYKILSKIGSGSFSSVYLANDSEWAGNMVAVKEIRTDFYTEEEYAQLNVHFLREAAFLMSLSHPGLPRVIEFFALDLSYYLVLEWIGGKDLEKILLEKRVLEVLEVVGWGRQLCDVLHYLHDRKPYPVIVGDLKPSNVICRFDGKVILVDFGVARHAVPHQGPKNKTALVTPGFSPPEQYRGRGLTTESDLYALGATLYWLLTGQDMARFSFQVPPLCSLRPDAPPDLELLVARLLKTDPAERPGSAAAVGKQLQAIGEQMKRDEGEFTPGDILSALYRKKKT